MGQLTFCLLHFREKVNVIKSLLNFDDILNSINMETQVVAKNMIMAVVDWGQKMAAHPKTWCGNVSVVGLCLNLISLLPKTYCDFFSFLLAMDPLHLFPHK